MPAYHGLEEQLRTQPGRHKAVVLDAARPYLIAALHEALKLPILVLTAHPERSRKLLEQLQIWCPDPTRVRPFPELDALPYERLTADPATQLERLQALSSLISQDECPASGATPHLIVTSVLAAMSKTMPVTDFNSSCQLLRQGMHVAPQALLLEWQAMGYERQTAVEVPGEMSQRGGIIDIYPPNSELSARIELLGNQIESLRLFNPSNQRSTQLVPSISIIPAREILLPQSNCRNAGQQISDTLDLSRCTAKARGRIKAEVAMLREGQWFPDVEFYAPLFNIGCILDYLPQSGLLILDEPDAIEVAGEKVNAQAEELRRERIDCGELPLNFPLPYFAWSELEARIGKVEKSLDMLGWGGTEEEPPQHSLTFTPSHSYGGQLQIFLRELKEKLRGGQRIIVVSQQASRLSEFMGEEDIIAPARTQLGEVPPPGSLTLVQGSLAEGWQLGISADPPHPTRNLVAPRVGSGNKQGKTTVLLTDTEVFGFTKQRRLSKKRPVHHQAFLSEIQPGDYVVHVGHGIARFGGLTRIDSEGSEREYLILNYASGDRLYVPTTQIDRVSRYIGGGEEPPALSRLGTQEWARVKQRVKDSVGNIAQELLGLYAAREVIPGFAFSPDTLWQQELEAAFPYVETPDQIEAVQAVKEDMERAKPMDRLICGDVGYGKTEVALRAAFKAVLDGKQVAILVPTTVLAEQHFATFTKRLQAFPLKVEVLSRFCSEKEQRSILEGLANGTVDICIGTHRLLQKDVVFKDLGLVIIDEEQRFGVAHKERLKQMRKQVDVITLSATPIPRTLHMSLAGVRDMSTMETPPEERLPIKTYVAEWDDRLVREAILRELERNGQVFFVHNRVQTISAFAHQLEFLVPEARIAIAHGQMAEEELEAAMLDFTVGKSDVLVCTTIIESGLDIPNVNTLIVNRADRLGLTQLYQLRGRVGRGSNRAYAYFLVEKGKRLTPQAKKRLKTIFEAQELGAGFRIAMRDLEIRGAGNLLGVEQSGHIAAVGFDLYCRLLSEAVEELKAKQDGVPRARISRPAPPIALPLSGHIPEGYVPDLSTRLALYQRLARAAIVEEVEDIAQELADRFGALPAAAEDLLYMVKIKLLAIEVGIDSISTEGKQIVLRSNHDTRIQPPLAEFGEGVKARSKQVRLDLKLLGEKWRQVLEGVLKRIREGAPVQDKGVVKS